MKRIEVLDGMRGYFLLFMLINHMILQGGLWLQNFSAAQLMFVEDAQGFVFLSGFLIGLIQTSRMTRYGVAAMRASIWRRAGELYIYAMGVILLALTLQAVLPGGVSAFANWMGTAGAHDRTRDLALATLVFQPTFMDILPQYILYLLVSPFLVQMVAEGRWPQVAVLSILTWMAAQIGMGQVIGEPLHRLALASDGQGLRGGFNPLGWQIVFISGLIAGGLTARDKVDWQRIFAPDKTVLPILFLMILLFFLPIRIATAHGLIRYDYLGPFEAMAVRQSFGPVYLLNLIGAAGLLTWLMVAGPQSSRRWIVTLSRGLHALFRWLPLKIMGRHSLQTYAWHVVIVYLLRYADAQLGPFTLGQKTAIAALCILLLPLPAIWRDYGPAIRRKIFSEVG
ncbi:MAG: OpgC domain-containing protein [Paracoccaceae bacterium]|nr:OpgC domain-containing protein [Paracoccaceae bacterium]